MTDGADAARGRLDRPDPARVARVFDRLARRGKPASPLETRALESLTEHLAPIRLSPRLLLDIGSGAGDSAEVLGRVYPRARVVSVDLSPRMLTLAHSRAPRWFSRRAFVRASTESLPVAPGCADLVVAHLVTPWIRDLRRAFEEMRRALTPHGLVIASGYGARSLESVHDRLHHAAPGHPRLRIPDLHEVADAMMAAGLKDVVADSERIDIRYPNLTALRRDLLGHGAMPVHRHLGAGTALRDRSNPLAATSLDVDGGIATTVELVFTHGWNAPVPARAVSVPGPLPRR